MFDPPVTSVARVYLQRFGQDLPDRPLSLSVGYRSSGWLHTTLTQTSSPLRALGWGLPYVVWNLIIENLRRTMVLS